VFYNTNEDRFNFIKKAWPSSLGHRPVPGDLLKVFSHLKKARRQGGV